MAASVSADATTGSHQVAAPIAMRLGMASGAVSGNQATSRAQVVSTLPMVAKDTMNAEDEDDRDRPGDAGRVLGARRERTESSEHRCVEGVAEQEPHDRPGDHAASHGWDVERSRPCAGDQRDRGGCRDLGEPEEPDAGDLAGQQVAGWHAGEEDLDGPARLLLDDAAEHHGAVGADRAEQHEGHDERGGLVVRAAARHLAELDVGDGHGFDDREEFVGADPGGCGAVARRRRAGWRRSRLP